MSSIRLRPDLKSAARIPLAWLGRLLLLAACFGPGPAPAWGSPGAGLTDDFGLADDFSSPVALVILDYGSAAGDGLTSGSPVLKIIARPEGGPARPGDPPTWEARANFETGPEGSAKAAGRLELIDEAGAELARPLLNLPPSPRWSLIGSDRDKMMLREYLARELGREFRPDSTPSARYCEVLLKREGKLSYQGLYLFSEYVEGGLFLAPEALRAREYVARAGAGEGRAFEIVYAAPGLDRNSAAGELSRLVAGLAATDRKSFFSALDRLDLNSFIDAYLFCRLMGHYPGENSLLSFHKDREGRVAAGPRWAFGPALDNTDQPVSEEEREELFNDLDPWFSRLLHDADFLTALRNRFFTLERGPLFSEKSAALVEALADDLGPALERDWSRWREAYEAVDLQAWLTDDGDRRDRRTRTPEQEILKLKYQLRRETALLKKNMEELRWKRTLFPRGQRGAGSFLLVLAFVGSFFAVVRYARRRM